MPIHGHELTLCPEIDFYRDNQKFNHIRALDGLAMTSVVYGYASFFLLHPVGWCRPRN